MRFLILLLAALLISGCCTRTFVRDCPESKSLTELTPGDEGKEIRVKLKDKCNATAIRIVPECSYTFIITQNTPISDGPIKCLRSDYESTYNCTASLTPYGFTTEELPWKVKFIMGLGEWARPLPDGKWLELVGTVGQDDKQFFSVSHYAKSGEAYTYVGKRGELFLLANDYPYGRHYDNNVGEVTVTIKCKSAAK